MLLSLSHPQSSGVVHTVLQIQALNFPCRVELMMTMTIIWSKIINAYACHNGGQSLYEFMPEFFFFENIFQLFGYCPLKGFLFKGFLFKRFLLKRFLLKRFLLKRFLLERFLLKRFLLKRFHLKRFLLKRFLLERFPLEEILFKEIPN